MEVRLKIKKIINIVLTRETPPTAEKTNQEKTWRLLRVVYSVVQYKKNMAASLLERRPTCLQVRGVSAAQLHSLQWSGTVIPHTACVQGWRCFWRKAVFLHSGHPL